MGFLLCSEEPAPEPAADLPLIRLRKGAGVDQARLPDLSTPSLPAPRRIPSRFLPETFRRIIR